MLNLPTFFFFNPYSLIRLSKILQLGEGKLEGFPILLWSRLGLFSLQCIQMVSKLVLGEMWLSTNLQY